MFLSFRVKIVLWYTVVALSTLLVFRLVSMEVIRQRLYSDLDNSLRDEVEWVRALLIAYKARGVSDNEIFKEVLARSQLSLRKEFIEIYSVNGVQYLRSPNLGEDQLRPHGQAALDEPKTVENFRNRPVRLFGRKDASYEIYIAYPTTDIEAALQEVLSSFFILIVPALLLFAAGGLFLVSRFLRSLTELSEYAGSLLKQPMDKNLPDISPKTRKELGVLIERINPLVEKMRESMKHVLSFASLASHELRTPLAIVRNELENALQSKTSAGELKKTVASSYNEILRMSRNVEDLLSLSTMQAGTFRLDRTKVALHTLIKDFYDEALFLSREKNISVVLGQGPKAFIDGDESRIRQMLFNLLDNAIKHTPEKGRIRLSYELQEKEVVVHFADTGPGIPPSELPKIFDPFHRVDGASNGGRGAGLGLSLVKWIIEAHGGSVSVESELGEGTKFTLRFPSIPSA